ncbi:MAG TPA: mannose-1-phosphate guanylyltransferase/mannose-6-phosphate isomerase, partial [Hyphomicrobiaceae bacterium]|nr:mannose-1-phosphate guanylyltransferase/mannose-6-phosphate isomerase [Hyphomicrobiaceae bacterium]
MANSRIFPVILSGGSGTRLWPLSRQMYPKQFVKFFKDQDTSFLGSTLHRVRSAGFNPPTLLCNNDHRFLIQDELERQSIDPRALILEPVARNTGPAIAVAAIDIMHTDPNGIMVVMPSDHLIADEAKFRDAIELAASVAETGRFVLFGIKPDEPHTGYGYIRRGAPLPNFEDQAFLVDAFVEKPDVATAEKYLADGMYCWNSGIFVLPVREFIEELSRLEPSVVQAARNAWTAAKRDDEFCQLDEAAYSTAPNISIDYAVMERTSLSTVVPVSVGWNDVGSWSSLWEIAKRDDAGNHVQGEAVLEDTTGSYIYSDRAVVSTIGVEDLVIVNTPDALLVSKRDRAQDVSSIVARLKASGRTEHAQHLRNHRPWGYFETLSIGPRFQVKKLHVKPGGKLSLQMHHHRSEHWIVVQGTAKVVISDIEKLLRENESVYIFATQ